MAEILRRPENRACAECGEAKPRWSSVSLGVLICTECAGVHRKLGTHISFVQSVTLDTWKEAWIERVASVGNAVAAQLYEARLPRTWSRPQLKCVSGDRVDTRAAAHMERFIRAKYELKLFARRDPRDLCVKVLNTFYDGMREQHAREQQLREAAGRESSPTQRNRQDVYLDEARRSAAYAASLAFLGSKGEWLQDPQLSGQDALMARVALQHFISLDIEDLTLPAAQRRSSDSFEGPHADVSEQFLKDATRGEFRVCGEEFNFLALSEIASTRSEVDTAQLERLSADFTERLVDALRRGLGGIPAPLLLRAVTMVMSQSAMAHLERACCSPPVVVSGGDQTVRYVLEAHGEGEWEVQLDFRRSGFSQAFVYPEQNGGAAEPPKHVSGCLPGSIVARSCAMRVRIEDDGDVTVDVSRLEEEFQLLGQGGASVAALTAARPRTESFQVLLRRGEATVPFGLAPCRVALRRGVLKLRAGVVAGTPVAQWNQSQDLDSTKLREGDFVISVNGVQVSRADGGSAALNELKQEQVTLAVTRVAPLCAGLCYEQLLADVYLLFNPAKIDNIAALLAKEPSRKLFLRVCAKYAQTADDWHDIFRIFSEHAHGNEKATKVVAVAEGRLERLKLGEELALLDKVCRFLIDEASFQNGSQQLENLVDQDEVAATSGDHHLSWEQHVVTLRIASLSEPLGLRHDRALLQQRQLLVVTEVLLQTSAHIAGLQLGDVIESIGGSDAAKLLAGGGKLAAAAREGCLQMTLRRPPDQGSGCLNLEPRASTTPPPAAVVSMMANAYTDAGKSSTATSRYKGAAGTSARAGAASKMANAQHMEASDVASAFDGMTSSASDDDSVYGMANGTIDATERVSLALDDSVEGVRASSVSE